MTTSSTSRDGYLDLDGGRVHFVSHDGDGAAGGPTFLLVHGLGGSAANWSPLTPFLAERGRVLAVDLGGFGLTRVPPARATLAANLQLLKDFVDAECDRPVIVIGNSMGGLLAAQLCAQCPRSVAAGVLIDLALPPTFGGLPHPLVIAGFSIHLVPGFDVWVLTRREARFTPRQLVEGTLRLVTHDSTRVDPAVVEEHVELAERRAREIPDGTQAFAVAARGILRQLARRGTLDRMMHQILQPVLLLHGDRDLLINVRAARAVARQHPGWTYAEGAGLGHVPFLEDPDWVAGQIRSWLDARPQTEARAAAHG